VDGLRGLLSILAGALIAIGPLATRADAQVAAAAPINTYATPVVVVMDRSQPATFVNADIAEHDVVAYDAVRADVTPWWCFGYESHCPLFATHVLPTGETAPIEGLDEAQTGVPYTFYCTRHPFMKGTLIVAR
jgi:plastocyanin